MPQGTPYAAPAPTTELVSWMAIAAHVQFSPMTVLATRLLVVSVVSILSV